jgi:murein L,D-transpeptidase YcbB/YkuD
MAATIVMFVCLAVVRSRAAGGSSQADPQVASTVQLALRTATLPSIKWGNISDVAAQLALIYAREPDGLLWFDGAARSPALASTIDALTHADDHGLDPADYDAGTLFARVAAVSAPGASSADRASVDLSVSVAVVRIIKAARFGRVDPRTMKWGYDVAAKGLDLDGVLAEVRGGRRLADVLDSLEPPFAHYSRSHKQLEAYRSLLKSGEPPLVPSLSETLAQDLSPVRPVRPVRQRKLMPGQTWPGVVPLAARLRALGDLPMESVHLEPGSLPSASSAVRAGLYAGALVDAVKHFQLRHGLEPDGVIGEGTIRTLNVPVAKRVRQLELAMERERWLPDLAGHPNVFVNIALFRLWGDPASRGTEPLRMNVVVGKSLNHQTPIFVEQMEYVIFHPYWNPPPSIIRNEILPHARKDPAYLDKEDMEIVADGSDDAAALAATEENLAAVAAGRLTLRQRPGPKNSLGLAKFIFPNDENVYMHGTPASQLFSRARRDFSHGCIRLEDPARFAEWVLRDQPEWDRAHIDKAMQGDRPTHVTLKNKLTVVLFYNTAHVNSEGVAYFVDDIYGHDAALDAALRRGYPYPTK